MMSLSKETSKAARFAIYRSQQNCRTHLEDGWAFLESVKGVRLRRAGELTSRGSALVFLAGTATRRSTHASSSPASARVPVISESIKKWVL